MVWVSPSQQYGPLKIMLGDARLSLRPEANRQFDLMVLDAFTSDAIPLHLLTREAIQMYFEKLKPNGILAIHVSNRYLDLYQPSRGRRVSSAFYRELGGDLQVKREDRVRRIEPSTWVVVARADHDFGATLFEGTWFIPTPANGRAWTDDYSNLWRALDCRGKRPRPDSNRGSGICSPLPYQLGYGAMTAGIGLEKNRKV